ALKKQGLKLAIMSNGEPKMLEAAAKSAGIRDLLDEVISVEEVKIFKTSNRVYWLATERLRVSNPELGFVSANNWDGVAAVSAGVRTFLIKRRTPAGPEEVGFQVGITGKAVKDLPALLWGDTGLRKETCDHRTGGRDSFPVRRCPTAPGCRSSSRRC